MVASDVAAQPTSRSWRTTLSHLSSPRLRTPPAHLRAVLRPGAEGRGKNAAGKQPQTRMVVMRCDVCWGTASGSRVSGGQKPEGFWPPHSNRDQISSRPEVDAPGTRANR